MYICMKVFYTASYWGKREYQKFYDMVARALEQTGVEVISTEKGNYLDLLSKGEKEEIGDKQLVHYEAIRRGIRQADAVVIEISNEDFQLGHEATLAIQAKKHVLCLSLHEDFSKKINNRYFHGKRYNKLTVQEQVEDFVEQAKSERLNQRFNMFLSSAEVEWLETESKKRGLGKSELVRELIDQDRL